MASFQLKQTGAQVQKALDDATKVVANPSTTASAGLNKITIGETTYSVQGGGGTYVEANPEGEATDTLNKVTIGETVYAVEGGSATTGMRTFAYYYDEQAEADARARIIDDATGDSITFADFEELLEKETIGIHFDGILSHDFNNAKIKFSTENFLIHTPTDYIGGDPYFKGITDVESVTEYEPGEDSDIPVWNTIGALNVLFFIYDDNYRIDLDYINYNDITLNLWNELGNDILALNGFCAEPALAMHEVSGYSLFYVINQIDDSHIPFKLSTGDQETGDILWCEFLNANRVGNQYKLTYKSTTTNQKYEIYINMDYNEATAFIDHINITEEGAIEKSFVLVNNNDTWEIQDKNGDTVDSEDFMNLIGSIVDGSSATVDLIYDPDDMRFNCHYKLDKYDIQDLGEQFTVTFINSKKQLILTLDTRVPEIADVQVTDRFSGGSGSSAYIDTDDKVSLYIDGADLPYYHTPEQPILE